MNAIQLINTHLELECIGVNSDGLLVRIPGPNPDDIARFYIAQHEGGYSAYFRHDLPRSIREQISVLTLETAFSDHDTVTHILAQDAPCADMYIGRSYIFPETLTPDGYPDAIRLNETHQALIEQYDPRVRVSRRAVYAIIVDGQIASTCESSRENSVSAEAWVRTKPEFRRRGFACQVTAAWAHNLQKQGKLPFYSHKCDNLASQSVAHGLGLVQYIADVGYG